MSKRNNREVSVSYCKDSEELTISWRQNNSIIKDLMDENMWVSGSPRKNTLSIHIRNLPEVLNKYSWQFTKDVKKPLNTTVASITTLTYNTPLSFRFIEKIKKLKYLLKLW